MNKYCNSTSSPVLLNYPPPTHTQNQAAKDMRKLEEKEKKSAK